MLRKILPVLSAALVLASCSSAYKGSQTPDDVYYSPARPVNESYAANERRNSYDRNNYNNSNYEDYTSSSEDAYLRMKIQNRYRWGMLDNFDYWNMPNYSFNFGLGYGYNPYMYNPYVLNNWYSSGFYSPFWGMNSLGWFGSYYPMYTHSFYNPYYGYGGGGYGGYYNPVIISKYPTRTPAPNVSRPSLNGYRNGLYNNRNNRYFNNNNYNNGRTYTPSRGRYNNNNSNNNSYTPSTPSRSYSPSPSRSGGSSGGGGGHVSRPPR